MIYIFSYSDKKITLVNHFPVLTLFIMYFSRQYAFGFPYFDDKLEFSLNALTKFSAFSDKKIKIKKENCRVGTQDPLCKRQRLYHCTTETIAREQILILNPTHASVISQIL